MADDMIYRQAAIGGTTLEESVKALQDVFADHDLEEKGEPMSDLIDRQAAIDAFDGVKVNEENCDEYEIGYNDGIDFAVSKLSVLPSADASRWIPCSERLPGKYQKVLTTIKGVDLFIECADKNFFEALAAVRKRTWTSVGILGEDGWYGADGYPQVVKPIAWMPLPKPYNGGKENETD